jgi:hypothetical protein
MPRVTYNTMVPVGAGAGYKVERVPAPPARGNCFANMQSAADLDMMCSSAPEDHRLITERLKQMGKVRGEEKMGMRPRVITSVKARTSGFGNGATVKDLERRKRGIIIKANAGYTAKSHKPVHKIADEDGNVWYQKEKHLKIIY